MLFSRSGADEANTRAVKAQSQKTSNLGAGAPRAKLSAEHISFYYGHNKALEDVSVPLYLHKVTAFMGPSGCGKSTLLRIFNRMHDLYPNQHVTGDILLDGRSVLGAAERPTVLRSRVGMVFQIPVPFPMSIYDNVAYGIRLYEDLSHRELDARVEEALRRAALWDEVKDILKRSGLSLSGGQQQRLCIARTIAASPEVILFDEPCSALDPISTAKIEETMADLKAHYTLAIVTHNLEQAARVSDYTAFMFLGKLIEFGTTHDIFHNPRDERTQRYLAGKFG